MSRARRDGTGNSEERDHFDDALRCLKSCETRFQEILSLLKEILIRFLVGGAVVSAFALVGDLLRPKSFAGLFGAAPSVALATLALTITNQGAQYAASESRSMILGAVAFFIYAASVCCLLLRLKLPAFVATLPSIFVWLGAAIGAWYVSLR